VLLHVVCVSTVELIDPQGYDQIFHGLGNLDYSVYSYPSPNPGFVVRSPNMPRSIGDEIDGEHTSESGDRRKRRLSSAKDKDSLSQIHSVRVKGPITPTKC